MDCQNFVKFEFRFKSDLLDCNNFDCIDGNSLRLWIGNQDTNADGWA